MDCQKKLSTDRKTLRSKSGADEDNGFAEFGGYMEAKIVSFLNYYFLSNFFLEFLFFSPN